MNSPTEIWNHVRALMEQEMTSTTINTWFDDMTAVALNNNTFVVHTPSNWKKEIITARYIPAKRPCMNCFPPILK